MQIPLSTPPLINAHADPDAPGSYLVMDDSGHLLASGADPLKAVAERLRGFGCCDEQTFGFRYEGSGRPRAWISIGAVLNQ